LTDKTLNINNLRNKSLREFADCKPAKSSIFRYSKINKTLKKQVIFA
jgi:hypothetical protein